MPTANAFRATIDDGGAVLGARAATFSPTVVETFGQLGLDFVWLDFEHGGPSPHDSGLFEDLTRAAEVADIRLLVRLPGPEPFLIRKVLDTGVRNLLIPRVDDVETVERAVEATRFAFDGRPGQRGMASGRARRWSLAEGYVDGEDETICVGVMIEKRGAIDDLEAILEVPHLGFAFVGPGDLSVQLGHPGETDHPEVREHVERIREACLAADVPLGGIAHDPTDAADLLADGYQIVRIGGEIEAARHTLADRLDQVRSADESDRRGMS